MMGAAAKRNGGVAIAPFKRRGRRLEPREVVLCRDEDAAGRRGRRMLERYDAMVFYRIECRADGDVWTEVLATIGVPEDDGA